MNFKSEFLEELSWRGFISQITHEKELDELMASEKISAYIGFDCTASSLHVGSLIQIMILRLLQKHKHKPIVLLGGGTTKIGDPSGKDESRGFLNEAKIAENLHRIHEILAQFINFGNSASGATLVNNDDWLSGLNYVEFLRDIGRHFSVNRMLTFDSVKLRLDRDQPLSFLEFNYMILQAYDFYVLNRDKGCRLQIGGSDQWGNIVNGVELIRRKASEEMSIRKSAHVLKLAKKYQDISVDEFFDIFEGNENALKNVSNRNGNAFDEALRVVANDLLHFTNRQAFGLTSPLLTTSDGKKMGKTADGAVWLDAEMLSPFEYFQYFRNTTDEDTIKFLKLFTDLKREEITEFEKLQGAEINKAKEELAFRATEICHGKKAAEESRNKAREIFVTKNTQAFEEISIALDGEKKLVEIIKEIGACASNGEARRLIEGKGVKINGEAIEDINLSIAKKCEFNLQIGKKKFFKILAR